jgi:replicative DNA helicase
MLLNLAVNMLQATSKSFYLFSYEEARKFLALKMILILAEQALHKKQNQEAYINYLRDKRGTNEAIEEAIQRYEIWISEGRLILSDEALPGDRLAKTIGRIAQAGNVGAIFVDYIQRIPWSGEGRRQLARYEEIKAVSALLLEQAVTTDIPIILGAQLGRGQGQGDKKKIRLDNLRESGDIENDANTVIGIFNESVAQMEEDGQEVDSPTVPLEVHLLKRRGGQAGKKVVLQFDRPILKIKDGSGKGWN